MTESNTISGWILPLFWILRRQAKDNNREYATENEMFEAEYDIFLELEKKEIHERF